MINKKQYLSDVYNDAVKWLADENNRKNEHYNEISLLVDQYYCGLSAKNELDELMSKL